jgi:hypothetical protein
MPAPPKGLPPPKAGLRLPEARYSPQQGLKPPPPTYGGAETAENLVARVRSLIAGFGAGPFDGPGAGARVAPSGDSALMHALNANSRPVTVAGHGASLRAMSPLQVPGSSLGSSRSGADERILDLVTHSPLSHGVEVQRAQMRGAPSFRRSAPSRVGSRAGQSRASSRGAMEAEEAWDVVPHNIPAGLPGSASLDEEGDSAFT